MSGRDASGTAWLPDASPMYAVHAQKGAWQLMAHENVFAQLIHESGRRGDDQAGSINWFMLMADRNAGAGHVGLRGMVSVELWTIRGCGYPDLLASGEWCRGDIIHDRQHPHDLFMKLSASYDAPLHGPVRWQVYGAPAGEPALGSVAYPHRVSAMPNPMAPIAHHWLDSTPIAFGVVTGAIYGSRWPAETSVFNGRELDERRQNFHVDALDSVSSRLTLLPNAKLALQVSGGHRNDAEAGEHGTVRSDVTRTTASAISQRSVRTTGIWATTIGRGRNEERDHATNALLLETNLTLDERDTWFGRFETVGKTAHDLDVPACGGDDIFTLAKLQDGYTRYFPAHAGLKPGLGAELSWGIVPGSVEPLYGSR